MNYFQKIIYAGSYGGNAESACYAVSEILFHREFWTKFTWTGVSKGNKSNRAFRSFGNIIYLLINIVIETDNMFNFSKLEKFCREKLFRHAKERANAQLLRKSTSRKVRSRKNSSVLVDADSAVEMGFSDEQTIDNSDYINQQIEEIHDEQKQTLNDADEPNEFRYIQVLNADNRTIDPFIGGQEKKKKKRKNPNAK